MIQSIFITALVRIVEVNVSLLLYLVPITLVQFASRVNGPVNMMQSVQRRSYHVNVAVDKR